MTAGGALVVAEAEDDQMRWIGSPRYVLFFPLDRVASAGR
jgi:hypothetical protein